MCRTRRRRPAVARSRSMPGGSTPRPGAGPTAKALTVGGKVRQGFQRLDDPGEKSVLIAHGEGFVMQSLGVASLPTAASENAEVVLGRGRQPRIVERRAGKTASRLEGIRGSIVVADCHVGSSTQHR